MTSYNPSRVEYPVVPLRSHMALDLHQSGIGYVTTSRGDQLILDGKSVEVDTHGRPVQFHFIGSLGGSVVRYTVNRDRIQFIGQRAEITLITQHSKIGEESKLEYLRMLNQADIDNEIHGPQRRGNWSRPPQSRKGGRVRLT